MKKTTILIMLCALTKVSFSQWTVVTSPTNYMYYNIGGKVGIDNSSPNTLLDVGSGTVSSFAPTYGQTLGATFRASAPTNAFRIGTLFHLYQNYNNSSSNNCLQSYMLTSNDGGGSISLANAISANAEHRASGGTLTWSNGVFSDALVASSGNITNWAAFHSGAVRRSSGSITGTVTNAYGLFLDTLPSYVTNRWGIFAADPNAISLIGGTLRLTAGAGYGKILTSDSLGNASWQAASSNNWKLVGNAGTTDSTNFIGTTDSVPFNIHVASIPAGRINLNNDIFLGLKAGGPSASGIGDNIAIGSAALSDSVNIGWGNVAIGTQALKKNRYSVYSVAIGYHAHQNGTGDGCTIIGAESGFTGAGGNNSALGYSTLNAVTTGNNNTALGAGADVAAGNMQNSTAIGHNAVVQANHTAWIGDANFQGLFCVNGQFQSGSDGRFKTNISEEDVKGLEFINRLRPVVYNFDSRKFTEHITKNMTEENRKSYLDNDFSKSSTVRQSGFIAQEVEQAAKETGYDFNGVHKPVSETDIYALAYSQFVVPLVKSVQQLSKQNDELKKEVEELKEMVKGNEKGSIKINGTAAQLFQNEPNPFTETTMIKYSIPSAASKAVLKIMSGNGTVVKEFDLKAKNAQVEIAGGQLKAGTYIYSLVVDDVLVDVKQMVLTK